MAEMPIPLLTVTCWAVRLACVMPITDITNYNNVTALDVITKITKETVLQDSHTETSLKADAPSFSLKSKG